MQTKSSVTPGMMAAIKNILPFGRRFAGRTGLCLFLKLSEILW
ncbi:MAG: hypothetical protein ACOYNW_15390 [Undibacterium curvum]|jgi:hypothetical protein